MSVPISSYAIYSFSPTPDERSLLQIDFQFFPIPDHHRDFPVDVLPTDETVTISAWAINEDNEVISPKEYLKVHSVETFDFTYNTPVEAVLSDYLSVRPYNASVGDAAVIRQFTVLK